MSKTRTLLLSGLAVGIIGLCLTSCSTGDTRGSSRLSRIDVTNATNLIIAPSGGGSQNTLYKVTSGGLVEQVGYFDKSGNAATISNQPTAIYDATAQYLIILFGSDGYLVRKSDGSAFSLSAVGVPTVGINGFKNDAIVKADSSGNIYYITGYHLIRIDTSDPNNITSTNYSPDTDVLDNFVVTADGNAAYAYPDSNKVLSGRVRLSNAGLYNLGGQYTFWIGMDGKIKSLEFGGNAVDTVNIDSSFNVNISTTSGSLQPVYEYLSYLVRLPTRTLIVGPDSIDEVENVSNAPRTVTISQLKTNTFAGNSSGYYYVAGTNAGNMPLLLKISGSNDAVTPLLPSNSYDIYQMTVCSDDTVTFGALRMSDSARVIGQIDSSGKVAILSTTITSAVVSLVRIE